MFRTFKIDFRLSSTRKPIYKATAFQRQCGASVSAWLDHTCGVRVDGFVTCWAGDDFVRQARPSEGQCASVSAGWNHTCGVRVGGSAACWRDDYDGEATPQSGGSPQSAPGVVIRAV